MSKDRYPPDDPVYTLEEILAEYAGNGPEEPEPAPRSEHNKVIRFPAGAAKSAGAGRRLSSPKPPKRTPAASSPDTAVSERSGRGKSVPPTPEQREKQDRQPPKEATPASSEAPAAPVKKPRFSLFAEQPKPKRAKEPDPLPFSDRLQQLQRTADEFAGQMFQEEEPTPEELEAEELIPGVDEEEEEPDQASFFSRFSLPERKPRPEPEPPADVSPKELAARYARGLGSLRVRCFLVFLLGLVSLYPALAESGLLPLPGFLGTYPLLGWICAGSLVLAILLSKEIFVRGVAGLLTGSPAMDTLSALAACFTLADTVTMTSLSLRPQSIPYCGAVCFVLACHQLGTLWHRKGLRIACRAAVQAKEPYQVTLDPQLWNGEPCFRKWAAPLHGFGSQVQMEDGAQRAFRRISPVLLLACLLLSLLATVARGQANLLLWALSATFTASASLGGLMCFSLPFGKLAEQLSQSGAALAGWAGARRSGEGTGILLTDNDLFPPGSITLRSAKIFGDFSAEKVVAVTATLLRENGGELDQVFHDLLRAQGGTYRRFTGFTRGSGGLAAEIRGEQILVGNLAFMTLMDVPLPPGLKGRSAIFCAVDGDLAGLFSLRYTLHPSVPPHLHTLMTSRLSPILATRDFNINPAMLKEQFKLPADRMIFPPEERRADLSDPEQYRNDIITAVLCREGIGPYAQAVSGARQLVRTVRLNVVLTCLGSVVGVVLTAYLAALAAFSSLSALSMIAFLFLWLVPVLLLSGWVRQD